MIYDVFVTNFSETSGREREREREKEKEICKPMMLLRCHLVGFYQKTFFFASPHCVRRCRPAIMSTHTRHTVGLCVDICVCGEGSMRHGDVILCPETVLQCSRCTTAKNGAPYTNLFFFPPPIARRTHYEGVSR